MMSAFWKCVCFILLGLLIAGFGANVFYPSVPRLHQTPTLFQKLYGLVWGGILVGVVWAICFRPQLEKLRLNLLALFTLVAMEAVFLMAVRIADPWYQFSH